MTDNEQNASQENGLLDVGRTRIRQELESLRDRSADVLHLMMPGVDHRLLPLAHSEWPHSAALEMGILDWLEEVLLSGERCEPRQQTLLDDNGRAVHVLGQHLLDDNWWMSVAGIRIVISEDEIAGTGPGVALAIARIKGSGRRLPYTAHNSARFS